MGKKKVHKKIVPKFYRAEVLVDGKWHGVCHAAWHIRNLGGNLANRGLVEPRIFYEDEDYSKETHHIPSKCWFTWKGWFYCKKAVMDTLGELNHEYRILEIEKPANIIYKDALQVVQGIPDEEDMGCSDLDISVKKYLRHIFYIVNDDDGEKGEGDFYLTKDKIESLRDDGGIMGESGDMIYLDPDHYEKIVEFEEFEGELLELESYRFE